MELTGFEAEKQVMGGRTFIRKLDLPSIQVAVAGQEILSKDGVAVKVSMTATYRIAHPRTAVMTVADFAASLHRAN